MDIGSRNFLAGKIETPIVNQQCDIGQIFKIMILRTSLKKQITKTKNHYQACQQ